MTLFARVCYDNGTRLEVDSFHLFFFYIEIVSHSCTGRRVQGTHLGSLMGIPATGKRGTLTGIDIYRIADGQIAEEWSNWDTLGLLQRMGLILPLSEVDQESPS